MVSLGHNELISRSFESWFIIIKKINNKKNKIKQDNGNYRNDDWVKIYVVGHQVWNEMMKYHLCIWMLYVWVFIDNITIVHILTMKTESRILKPKCFFVYVLMVECYELMILCVCICKLISCFLFLDGTLTISRNFFKLKRWINQILMMKFLEILEANLKII